MSSIAFKGEGVGPQMCVVADSNPIFGMCNDIVDGENTDINYQN